VTQFANRAGSRQASGAVIRVAPDGTRTRLGVGRLFFPSGAAVGADGSIYVSNWSVLPASTPRSSPFKGAGGQVVRITL